MTHYTYERLSYEDNGFLRMETPTNPMHVAGVQIFAAGPLATADGGIDAASIRRLTESVLHRIPRYRQKLAWIPGQDHAVWVDDPNFNLDYHVRHTARSSSRHASWNSRSIVRDPSGRPGSSRGSKAIASP
jgi:hypothetical protein